MEALKSKFRGSLTGVILGDCFGAPFEGSRLIPGQVMDKIDILAQSADSSLKYTDDTAMTISTCKSLLQNKRFDAREMAKEFSESYFKEPNRGYGQAVRQVFKLLRDTKYVEPFGPAASQFNGGGSFGNGAAMRCNGIALFAHKLQLDQDACRELVENCSRLTHSHSYGINGALLLVNAIRYVLALEGETLEEDPFLDHLIKYMTSIEQESDRMYTSKLKSIKQVIGQNATSGIDVNQEQIVALLGNDVSAQNSVPLAIYSFLRGISKFNDSYRIDNEVTRSLHWAISCGGDTDTIASMACGLSGAYLGHEKVPQKLYKKCEGWEKMIELADQLASV